MVKRITKHEDGKYHIKGKVYDLLEGSRAQVWHGTAYRTAGGLVKSGLTQNKHGRIVSSLKHKTAKKEKRLEKAGYKTEKGKFGAVKVGKGNKFHKSKKARKGKRQGKRTRKSRGRK